MKAPILIALSSFVAFAIVIDANLNGYEKIYPPEIPIVNLPLQLRQSNWKAGRSGSGSCTWASMVSLLRWQGKYGLASKIRRTCAGGVYLPQFGSKLDSIGIRYAVVSSGDPEFLRQVCNTRRGAAVGIRKGKHMVALVHIDNEQVCLLDNNSIKDYMWIPRDVFVVAWRKSGGWAFVPVYDPIPPLP